MNGYKFSFGRINLPRQLLGVDNMNKQKIFLFVAIFCIAVFGLAFADSFPNTNLNNDSIENFYDFAILANNWQQTGTGLAGDFDDSNAVDIMTL